MNHKIYICYVQEDKETAEKLYADLKAGNLNPWMKDKNIVVGQNKEIEANKAIQKCSAFIALLSSRSVSKVGKYQKELRIAFDLLEERPYGDIFVIPVILDQCSRPDMRFENIHWADMSRSYESGLNQILRAIEAIPHSELDIQKPEFSPISPKPLYPEEEDEKTETNGEIPSSRSPMPARQKVLGLMVAAALLLLTGVLWWYMDRMKESDINLSGTWRFTLPEEDADSWPSWPSETWIIHQDGNKLKILHEEKKAEFRGNILSGRKVTFERNISVTGGANPVKFYGEGNIDESGNEIKGTCEQQGLSGPFQLERIGN